MKKTFAVLAGDGIGPEIVQEAVKVLRAVATRFGHAFTFDARLVGGAAYDAEGDCLPAATLAACRAADAVLLGAVGGPKWDALPGEKRPERRALLTLRRELGLFANLRPAKVWDALRAASPLKPEIVAGGIDLLVVRELTGGLYFGAHDRAADGRSARDELPYSAPEIARIARVACAAAQKRQGRVTCVDKANVLATSRLWREVVQQVRDADFPDVALDFMYVDNAAMQLVRAPGRFDVILTENMFGDILSDEASQITGSIGMLPSASLRDDGFGLYEPIHGSAPDIAGKGIANPLATILSAALMLRHSCGLAAEADAIERAVGDVLARGLRTADLGGDVTCAAMGDAVAAAVAQSAKPAGRVYFVSGIDTGIGKTAVTGLMARALAAAGHDVITVKMVQTGNDGFSEDIDAHRALCGRHYPEDDAGLTAPQIFKFPSSPQLAARLEGRAVDLAAIRRAVAVCAAQHEIVLVESAGGLDVPLTEDDTLTIDVAAACGWPLILVTCGRLGSINHTLLSLEAAKARGMAVAGVVHDWCDGADPLIDRDTPETTRRFLARWGFPPVVVRVPRFDLAGPYPDVDFSELFA